MDYKISREKVKALLQYLSTRPHGEVRQGVEMLEALEPIEEPAKATSKAPVTKKK